jgi:hypothetical protein
MTLNLSLMNSLLSTRLASRQTHTHTFSAQHAETLSNPSFESTRLSVIPYLAYSPQERCTQTPHCSSPAPDQGRLKSAGISPKIAVKLTSIYQIQDTSRTRKTLRPVFVRIERLSEPAEWRLKKGSIRQNRGRAITCRKQTPLRAHPASQERLITCRNQISTRPHPVAQLRLITWRKQMSTRHHPAPQLRLITLGNQTSLQHHPAPHQRLRAWGQQTTSHPRLGTANHAPTLCQPIIRTASWLTPDAPRTPSLDQSCYLHFRTGHRSTSASQQRAQRSAHRVWKEPYNW